MFKVSDFEREICGDFQLGFEYEEDEKDNLSPAGWARRSPHGSRSRERYPAPG